MAKNHPGELFVMMLSNLRRHEERAREVYRVLSKAAKNTEIKEALESRGFLEGKILNTIDQCFNLMGEKPEGVNDQLQDDSVEDLERELAGIKTPAAKMLFVAAKANHTMRLRISEYRALVAMADITERHGVAVLLGNCLADKLAFIGGCAAAGVVRLQKSAVQVE